MVKKIEDICNGLDTIPACDRQTDRRTDILPRIYVLCTRRTVKIQFSILSSRSLMYVKKSSGPKTEPCGMPLSTSAQENALPFQQTLFSICQPSSNPIPVLPVIP